MSYLLSVPFPAFIYLFDVILTGMRCYCFFFNLISLMTDDVEHFLVYFWAILSFLKRNVYVELLLALKLDYLGHFWC